MSARRHRLFTAAQMRAADAGTIAKGTPGTVLMDRAARGAAEDIMASLSARPTLVLCGPGNNGGDGHAVAALLRQRGWPVRVALLGEVAALKGDAAWAAGLWQDARVALAPDCLAGADLVVDALFGTGLGRPIDGDLAKLVEVLNAGSASVIALDMPSGICSDTGAVLGTAVRATRTLTFGGAKLGQALLPGKRHCGALEVIDIGLDGDVVDGLDISAWRNHPDLWRHTWRPRDDDSHKYRHGHALVLGGRLPRTGAARLAARAALRVGAGLVTVLSPASALMVYAGALEAVMVEPVDDGQGLAAALADPRRNAIALGPGAGVGEATCQAVLAALHGGKACVLDADALTSFADRPQRLFDALAGRAAILTPHEGECARLFADLEGDRLSRARAAAARSDAVVVLKGGDSIIASPDGRVVIETQAPPWLATAGSGDVLTGLALGLRAQGMPAFEAACAAVWLHGQAARAHGPGLIADDLERMLPGVLGRLAGQPSGLAEA